METNKKIKEFTDYLDSVNDNFLPIKKDASNDICANCGAGKGLHHFASFQCPKNGIEEYRNGRIQEWQNTVFEDSGIKAYGEKAIAEYDKPKEDNAMLLEAIEIADKWMYIKGAYQDNAKEYDIIRFKEIVHVILH